ncbi:hypothetical protein AK812_SmicGene11762 [Symbiodinium microadriaticum]|uniref:Integrase catalytic domain-containing protein n=1 Tax=Symbiodinium microadriaticum TaxID=2951 RepID=A0A1Q9EC84_SYMMI|nr:hypothetical protein AK812_SmicGene11762 [Symbiodinium microadriaticum]
MEKMKSLCDLVPNFEGKNAAVFEFYGVKVPAQVPVRCRCPLGSRVIATSPSPGQWHVLQIDGANREYDLNVPSSVYVIQEFAEEFIQYAGDQEFEPIEVTMDRATKRRLNEAIDKVLVNPEQYFEMCEDEDLAVESQDFDGVEDQDQILDMDARRAANRYRLLPVDLEMTSLCKDLRKVEPLGEGWRDHHGQAMFITLHPRRSVLPQCGPGGRSMRWTAVMVKPGEWRWLEQGVSGRWHPEARSYSAIVVLYRWPEVAETYVLSYDLTDKEKSDVLRCHVNLGHPSAREFVRTSGAPQYLVFDEGREFTASTFQEGLERHGIIPLEVARNAPFTNGVVERRGGLFKEVYYRTRELVQPTTLEEVEILVFEVSWSLQTLTNRSGYSPAQRVLGKQPTLALDTLSDQREYHLSTTQDAAWQRAHEIRTAARTALIQVDAKARLARARLGRPRREIENLKFSEGEPVLVWRVGRRGATAKVGPCYVIHQEGHIVWVTRRGEIWKCHVSQVFKMSVADQAGLEMIPAELLEAKARLRYDSEKMQFVDVVSEADGDRRPGSGGPPDGRVKQELHDDRQLPTEIPVPDPLQDISGIDQNPEQLPADDSVQPANNDERHDDLQTRQLWVYVVVFKFQWVFVQYIYSQGTSWTSRVAASGEWYAVEEVVTF